MTKAKTASRVTMVGAFPPPFHGLSAVNASIRDTLMHHGVSLQVIDLASKNLERSLAARIRRLPTATRGLVHLLLNKPPINTSFYMSVSGGAGQLYEIAFVLVARLRKARIYLHHHSFSYLDSPRAITLCLIRLSGSEATHVTQSDRMAELLKTKYGVRRFAVVSNAVFLKLRNSKLNSPCRKLRTLGFIGNISVEKGIVEFLDLAEAAQLAQLPLSAKLAGPFQDNDTERLVRKRLLTLSNVDYVGPMYGKEKDRFFSDIDLLIFPTRYQNETEGIVNHEAMSRGIPVIAYGRGAVPEIIDASCGLVIRPEAAFVPAALKQIASWLADPSSFELASLVATQRFLQTYTQSERQWSELMRDVLRDHKIDLATGINKATQR